MEETVTLHADQLELVANQMAQISDQTVHDPQPIKPVAEPSERTAFVTLETETDLIKRKNLYLASSCIAFVWMLFHFTVVFFFTLILKSPVIVGVFLGLGNLVSLVLDVPVTILGRYFAPKKLFLFAAVSMLGAGLIFLKFIYVSTLFKNGASGEITTLLAQFLDSTTNMFLLAAAAGMYGFTKEVNDLTTLSYILNNSDPSEYGSIISKNNIFVGIGSLMGLLASGFILGLNRTAAILTLNVMVIALIGFIFTYFDSAEKTISIGDIKKLKVIAKRSNLSVLKDYATWYVDYAVWYVAKADFARLAKETSLIFLRPKKVESNFDYRVILPETLSEFKRIIFVVARMPFNISLIWYISLILAFGFWDTFAASFLIDYLTGLPGAEHFWYVLLGVIAIPAFVTQEYFIRMSKRFGRFWVASFWLLISGISLVLFGLIDGIFFVILFGLMNSLGYAAGMGLAQWGFLELYNSEYAKKQKLSEIDSNASASPMKIIQNLANVVGLTCGGTLLAIFGFTGFFAIFGFILIGFFGYSFFSKEKIREV